MKTKPEVFIIESVRFTDERANFCEGRILLDILALSGKKCAYYYIRTKKELGSVLTRFTRSSYRYLHISCHANKVTMATTLDRLSIADFAEILHPHLKDRRLFLSACSLANDRLASLVMPGSGCYSLLGPAQTVRFNDAAILWASLYHIMFAADEKTMTGHVLRQKAREVANLYRVPLTYFGRDRSKSKQYIEVSITPKKPTHI